MEKGFNLRMKEFEEDILLAINKAKLPPRVCAMVFENIANQMNEVYIQAAKSEKEAFEGGEKYGEEIHKS